MHTPVREMAYWIPNGKRRAIHVTFGHEIEWDGLRESQCQTVKFIAVNWKFCEFGSLQGNLEKLFRKAACIIGLKTQSRCFCSRDGWLAAGSLLLLLFEFSFLPRRRLFLIRCSGLPCANIFTPEADLQLQFCLECFKASVSHQKHIQLLLQSWYRRSKGEGV